MKRGVQKQHPYACILTALILTMLPLQIYLYCIREKEVYSVWGLAGFAGACLLAVAVALNLEGASGIFREQGRFLEGMKQGGYLILAGAIFAVFNVLGAKNMQVPEFSKAVLFLAVVILGAVFEEILFRGIVQNLLVDAFQEKGKSVKTAVMIGAGIFGLFHFLNLIGKPYLVLGTFTQVLYTFSMGMVLGTAYYLSHSIWAVAVIHSVFNLLGSGIELFQKTVAETTKADIAPLTAVIQLAVMLPGIYVAWRGWKKAEKAGGNVDSTDSRL